MDDFKIEEQLVEHYNAHLSGYAADHRGQWLELRWTDKGIQEKFYTKKSDVPQATMLDEMLSSQMVVQIPDTAKGNERKSFLERYGQSNVIDPESLSDAALETVDAVRKQRARDYRLGQEWCRRGS